MNKLLLLLLLNSTSLTSFCQVTYPYQDIKLEKQSDYTETEPLALSAATFLLTTPFAEVDTDRANALRFLSKWMTGTKDYSFYLQGVAENIRDDVNVLSLFIAAMVKYSLEHKEVTSSLTVEQNACKLVLAYCDNAANNFKLKKKIRKRLENN
ncbi:MAG: hypothetical protein WBP16_03480 [Ferruginibacter sp.]